jgi:multidrug efflux pump subunit AcrA (membrane-fusion protein)
VVSIRLALLAVACVAPFQTAWAAPEKPKVATVFVSEAKPQDLFDLLSYPARVEPKVSTTILADSDGVVSKLVVSLGQSVPRRGRLMTITHTDPVYRYAPVHVTAPVAGVVSQVEVTEGTEVAKGQKLALVTDPTQVRLKLEIPAADLKALQAGLKTGMTGEFTPSGRDEKIAVRIKGVSPYVDPATGTATCELELASASAAVAPGSVGQVSFQANRRQGFSVPDHALLYKGDDPYLRLAQEGKAKLVAVKLGRKQRGVVEILSGLTPGALVIERASRYVADGEEVSVQK